MAPEFGWEVGMLLDVRSGPIFLSLYRTMYEALVRRLHDNGGDNNDSVIRERQRTCARETEKDRIQIGALCVGRLQTVRICSPTEN